MIIAQVTGKKKGTVNESAVSFSYAYEVSCRAWAEEVALRQLSRFAPGVVPPLLWH
jgi:diacylglycerol kinase